MLMDLLVTRGQFSVKSFSKPCWGGASPKMKIWYQWPRKMVNSSPLEFFGLGQPVPAAGWDLNFLPEGNVQVQPADNIHGDWDQWIVNDPPAQQPQQDLPRDEQQVNNPHSDLSSDSSSGPIHGVPVQNGQILDDLDVVGPVLHFNAPALSALGDVPMDGLQEIDGPPIQGDLHVPGILLSLMSSLRSLTTMAPTM
jgi:hypothetical protein